MKTMKKIKGSVNIGGMIGAIGSGVTGINGDDYSPFDMPIKKEIQERLDEEERREVEPPHPVVEETVLKSVYCNYRGRLTVYDVHGQKVHDLSGMITYEKYTEIERRSNTDITEFDGIEDYRRISAELKKTVVINDQSGSMYSGLDDFADFEGEPRDDPFSQSVSPVSFGLPQPNQNPPPGGSVAALATSSKY